MKRFCMVVIVELFKIFKSKFIWITFIAFTIAPLMASFFMVLLNNPQFAENAGLLGSKAQIAGGSQLAIIFGFICPNHFCRRYFCFRFCCQLDIW